MLLPLIEVGECSCSVGEPPFPFVALTSELLLLLMLLLIPPPLPGPPLVAVLPELLWMLVCPWPPGEEADTPFEGCEEPLNVDTED